MTMRDLAREGLLGEVLFQQHLESLRGDVYGGDLLALIDVLSMAIGRSAREQDLCCRVPQWLLEFFLNFLDRVFLAPVPPGWFTKIRRKHRQRLSDLLRFQKVVRFRCEGHNFEDSCDLAAQCLQKEGYEGGCEAVRWSYKRVLKSLRDVETSRDELPIAADAEIRTLDKHLAPRQVLISDFFSKTVGAIGRRARQDEIGSSKPRQMVEVPHSMQLSVAEALLLCDKILPGLNYLRRAPSLEEDGVLENLVNRGNVDEEAMAFAREHREARGFICFGPKPGTACNLDPRKRPIGPSNLFFVDRGLAFRWQPYDSHTDGKGNRNRRSVPPNSGNGYPG